MNVTSRWKGLVALLAAAPLVGCGGETLEAGQPELEATGSVTESLTAQPLVTVYQLRKYYVSSTQSYPIDFLYSTSNSEGTTSGYQLMGANFYLFRDPATGLAPLYRCRRSNGDHFMTRSSTCDGAGTREFIIGYVATTKDIAIGACGGKATGSLDRQYYIKGDADYYGLGLGPYSGYESRGSVGFACYL